jgi:hypothetical protein
MLTIGTIRTRGTNAKPARNPDRENVGHVAHLLTALPAVWVCTRFPVEACRVVEGLGFPSPVCCCMAARRRRSYYDMLFCPIMFRLISSEGDT